MTSEAIRVFVVDDHPMVVEGLTSALTRHADLAVVGTAGTAEEAERALEQLPVDVVIVDYVLPGANGAALCAAQARRATPPKCIVLSGSDDPDAVVTSFASGAHGYLLKDVTAADLAHAVRRVHANDPVIDERLTASVVRGLRGMRGAAPPAPALGPRERELLRYLADGMSNADISRQMHVSTSSVKNYVSRLMTLLGVDTRTAAVAKAARQGLL